MLTVDISVNGKTVYARSGRRRTANHARKNKVTKKLEQAYLLDSGEVVYHDPAKGILSLVIKIIKTIREDY